VTGFLNVKIKGKLIIEALTDQCFKIDLTFRFDFNGCIISIQSASRGERPPSEVSVARPEIGIFVLSFRSLERRYFDMGMPDFM